MTKKVALGLALLSLVFAGGCQKGGKPKVAKGLQKIHFDFDQSDVKAEYKPVMKANAAWAKDHADSKLVIEGHCDERGSDEYNIALGQRRANSAKNYLGSLGVSASRVVTKSYGEEKPAKSCSNEGCWQENRRAEFLKQ
ncbi:MAG: peptidoglycan-associated lipoprotein Pal [bacterium]|nr:peptidoglycan-associated lipoprotein Pal [bacterium]